jgi:hypothetical protein
MSRDGWGGRAARRWVAAVLATYGTTCHLCHHGQADSGDHVRPRIQLPRDAWYDVANGRPVHHKPCPVCGVRCNNVRKDRPLTTTPTVDGLGFFERHPPG